MTEAAALDFRSQLGDDLWELVEEVRSPIVEMSPVTTLASSRLLRGSYKLRFADGRLLKGRRFESQGDAAKMVRLAGLLDPRYFPRVVAHRGSAVLVQWVDGCPSTGAPLGPGLLEQCGVLLGGLHTLSPPREILTRYVGAADNWLDRMARNIERLVRLRALDEREGALALESAGGSAPIHSDVGLIHGDLCSENIVVTASGRSVVIDNETLSIDALAYDLGRTWHRWRMNREEKEAFYRGYHRYRSSSDFVNHFLFWAIVALSEAAVFRLQGATQDMWEPVNRLRRLLEGKTPGSPLDPEVP